MLSGNKKNALQRVIIFTIIQIELSFDPLLLICFSGLIEEAHPYGFIARETSRELLESSVSYDFLKPKFNHTFIGRCSKSNSFTS